MQGISGIRIKLVSQGIDKRNKIQGPGRSWGGKSEKTAKSELELPPTASITTTSTNMTGRVKNGLKNGVQSRVVLAWMMAAPGWAFRFALVAGHTYCTCKFDRDGGGRLTSQR